MPKSIFRRNRSKTLVASALMLFVLVGASCESDDSPIRSDDSPGEPDTSVSAGTLSDWVAFDEHVFFAIDARGNGEPFLDGDDVIGEPFTDVNANGVFDPGIDIFIKSNDASINQDLNHNGKYDGPDGRWIAGVPYDDLNGNGVYDYPSFSYDMGEFFLDLNKNGTWGYDDGVEVIHWLPFDTVASTVRWCYEFCDSLAHFTSDSGRDYWLPELRTATTWDYANDRPRRDTQWIFETSDSGLVLVSTNMNARLHVLPMGEVQLDSHRVTIPFGHSDDSVSLLRIVSTDEQVQAVGVTVAGLLCVRYIDAWVNNDSTYIYPHIEWKIYFARDHGIVSVQEPHRSRSFPVKHDSLPMPLIQ